MKRNILYIAIACMTLLASCKKEIKQVLSEAVEVEFGATVDESNGAKTYLDGTSVLWADGDQISVNGTAIDLVAGAGYRYGTFRGKVTPYNTNSYYVGYPASATTFSAGTMSVAIPAAQTYNSTQTLLGYMPMAAYIEGTGNKMTLHFHNAANLLKLQLFGTAGDASKVTKIEITSTTALTGKVPVLANGTGGVTFDYVHMTENLGNTIILDCGTGVQLGADAAHATAFYVIIPKIASSAALNVKIYCANGAYQENALTSTFNSVNMIYSTAVKEVSASNIGLPGEFSVADGKKVQFSQGNLYYTTATGKYSFEANQYDFRHFNGKSGDAAVINGASTTTPSGTVGSFFWVKNNETSINPYDESYGTPAPATTVSDIFFTNATSTTPKADFTCNGATGVWRTMSGETGAEWDYLLTGRTDASLKCGYGTVASVHGIIILPDSFTDPRTNTSSYASAGAFCNQSLQTGWNANVYTSGGNWEAMETAGAVFLPAVGVRYSDKIDYVGVYGDHWTSTTSSTNKANRFSFTFETYTLDSRARGVAFAVRLVKDASNSGGAIEPFELENW